MNITAPMTIINKSIDATAVFVAYCPSQPMNTSSQLIPCSVFIASRNMNAIPMNMIAMNSPFQNPFSSTTPFSSSSDPLNVPMSMRKNTLSNNRMIIWLLTAVIVSTIWLLAITRNPMTKLTIALSPFLVSAFSPSVPSTFVLSSIANTTVKVNKNGNITSYTPSVLKNSNTLLSTVSAIFHTLLFRFIYCRYLNVANI